MTPTVSSMFLEVAKKYGAYYEGYFFHHELDNQLKGRGVLTPSAFK